LGEFPKKAIFATNTDGHEHLFLKMSNNYLEILNDDKNAINTIYSKTASTLLEKLVLENDGGLKLITKSPLGSGRFETKCAWSSNNSCK
jgi:hypothetical protein